MGLPLMEQSENRAWLDQPKNFSRRKYRLTEKQTGFVKARCRELIGEYGYGTGGA